MKLKSLSFLVLVFAFIGMQAQTIQEGQKFWDGVGLYNASEILSDGTVRLSVSMMDMDDEPVEDVWSIRLTPVGGSGHYILRPDDDRPCPFRCLWGADVDYYRKSGMNFLAVKSTDGLVVETLVLTPDKLRDLAGQFDFMVGDVLENPVGAGSRMLLNTHLTCVLSTDDLADEIARLNAIGSPSIIEKTNLQLLQSEALYRIGEAEGGYDNPDGLGSDGRGPDEEEQGELVTFMNDEYIRVTNAWQFINALSSGQQVLIAKDTEINLTPALEDESLFSGGRLQMRDEEQIDCGDSETIISEEVFDGRQLTLVNFKQLTIMGEGNSSIVVSPRYSFCLRLVGCQQVSLINLTIGHTDEGYCQGGVIGVSNSWRTYIGDCDLYGCGTYGVVVENSNSFSMAWSNIRDCSYGIMQIIDTEAAQFTHCDFFRNREFTLVESSGTDGLVFEDCRFYDNNPTSALFLTDDEFYLSGCVIFHPEEALGSINNADQSGKKNWWSNDPKDSGIKPRDIGPDSAHSKQ